MDNRESIKLYATKLQKRKDEAPRDNPNTTFKSAMDTFKNVSEMKLIRR